MKIFGLLLLLQFFAVLLIAQQLPYYTQYRNFQSMFNPASVHSDFFLYEYNVALITSYRTQWINHEETPRTAYFSGEYITNFGGSFELVTGLNVLQDRSGPQGFTSLYGRIGALFSEDPYFGAFSVGFNIGMAEYRISASRIDWQDPEDPNIPLFDFSAIRPDIGFGLFYYKRFEGGYFEQDNLYFGFSVPQIIQGAAFVQMEDRKVALRRVPHFYATAGWYHFFNETAFLETSFWGKYVEGAPFNLDLMARLQPGRMFWAGLGYNLNGLVHLETGIHIPGFLVDDGNLKIGYAFDYNISAFDLPLGTSHEIFISFMFDSYR